MNPQDQQMNGFFVFGLVLIATAILSACERPPVSTEQQGFRGVGIVDVQNPRLVEQKEAANVIPEALPLASSEGPKAGAIYQNVQLLGDLSVGEFTRLMASMTQWIAPEEGCGYCHNLQNMASDEVYTKHIARSMIGMTRDANINWKSHVGDTGVTCYTCHRGNAVPEYVWNNGVSHDMAGSLVPTMQNIASESVGYTSLPMDPFTTQLEGDAEIRVISDQALPTTVSHNPLINTEYTYGLMIHMSTSLGVNCTYCHNSRAFAEWEQSRPQREVAWYAIRHVRDMNGVINSVSDVLPDYRKGELDDPYKVGCNTCHQGVYKPLYGVSMLPDFPSLTVAGDPLYPDLSYIKDWKQEQN